MSDQTEKLGKIAHHLFEEYIEQRCGSHREEIRVKPQFGVDVSIVDLPGKLAMAFTSDPLSLIPSLGLQESAWLSVQLMANDMATTGFAPMYGQFVLNLPADFAKNDFKIYWNHIHCYCENIGVAITGGHTGFVEGQHSTIAGGGTFTMVAPKDKILVSKMAQPGNAILVTKQCALSSTAILALSFPKKVKNALGAEIYHDACEAFYQTSSLKEALIATSIGEEVTAMHDVTEGGVLGAIYEIAHASNNGVLVYDEKLPIAQTQKQVCDLFELDPRFCIGAGSMIITCKPHSVQKVIERLAQENIECTEVGKILAKTEGLKLMRKEKATTLPYYAEDPYWAAFFNAHKKGWK